MSKLITPSIIVATVKYPSIIEEFIKEMDIKDPEFEFKPKNTEIQGRSSFSFAEYKMQQNETFDLKYLYEGHWFEFKNKAKDREYVKPQYLKDVIIKEFGILNHTKDGTIATLTQYILTIQESPFNESTFLINKCSLNTIEKLLVTLIHDNNKMMNVSLEDLCFESIPLEKGVSSVDGSFVIDGAELKNSIHGKKIFYFSVKQADIFE